MSLEAGQRLGPYEIIDPFGLEKVFEPSEASQSGLSHPPTLARDARLDGVILGTPAYMSPSRSKGSSVDARTDLFSAGATMYEALAGERPFQGATVESVLARILEVGPEPQ